MRRSLAPRLLRRPVQQRRGAAFLGGADVAAADGTLAAPAAAAADLLAAAPVGVSLSVARSAVPSAAWRAGLRPAAPSAACALQTPWGARWRSLATDAKSDDKADAKSDDKAEDGAKKAAGDKAEDHDEVEKQGKKGPEDVEPEGEEPAKPAEASKLSPKEQLEKEIEDLQEKTRAKKNDLLHALADFENNKKRMMKERENRRRRSMANFAGKMVEVYRDFDKLARQEDPHEGEPSDVYKSFKEGVDHVRDLYGATLDKFDVLPLSAEKGDHFVAARHEEVGSVADDSLPVHSIVEVVRQGWILEPDTPSAIVLEKAQVKTAKHGPEA